MAPFSSAPASVPWFLLSQKAEDFGQLVASEPWESWWREPIYGRPLGRFVVPIHINKVVKKPQAVNLVSRVLGGRAPRYLQEPVQVLPREKPFISGLRESTRIIVHGQQGALSHSYPVPGKQGIAGEG